MKKTSKRILALLLATLIAIGVGTSAGAAGGQFKAQGGPAFTASPFSSQAACSVTITTQPTDTTFDIYGGDPDLSGMVFEASGGIFDTPESFAYDEAVKSTGYGPGKIFWYFMVEPNDRDNWWKVGENAATLYISAVQCGNFNVMETVDGVEYGYYDFDDVFDASVGITVTGAVYDTFPYAPAKALALDVPAEATFPPWEEVYYMDTWPVVWFKFTAPADGHYSFRSDGGRNGSEWYDRDGEYREFAPIDPVGTLYTEDGGYIRYDDDRGGSLNFLMFIELKKDETVYLRATIYDYYDPSSIRYTVTVSAYTPQAIPLISNEITVNYHDIINIYALIGPTELCDIRIIDYGGVVSQDWWTGDYYASARGTGTMILEGEDGSTATLKVTVKYSILQWLSVIFLGGWLWLPITPIGEFSLLEMGSLLAGLALEIPFIILELVLFGPLLLFELLLSLFW